MPVRVHATPESAHSGPRWCSQPAPSWPYAARMTDSPELLTVSDAAMLAGVSARTMRRWANSGQVRTVGHGHGRRVVVASILDLPATPGQNGHEKRSSESTVSATTVTEADSGHEAGHLANLVRELTARLSEQIGLTAMWQERAGALGDRLAAAESKLLALAAPPSLLVGSAASEPPDLTTGGLTRRWQVRAPWLLGLLAIVAVVVLLVWPG
jgi:hypothetical protein